MNSKQYLPIIGLEIHLQLNTISKMFCGCRASAFGAKPNTQVCPVCLGLPGALPVPNRAAIWKTVQIALALGCQIQGESHFDRKNYFYPDLPKGYQITQYQRPIGLKGKLEFWALTLDNKAKARRQVRIRRVHLEEDTATLKHRGDASLIDFNRSGIPLVEIVTEPDLHSAAEAKIFLKKLRQIVRWIGASDANMEEGSMRIEPSVSILPISEANFEVLDKSRASSEQIQELVQRVGLPEWRVELKNINSFRFAQRAIEYEIQRLIKIMQNGKIPRQETRGYNESKGITFEQRAKEEEADYRYFPEPDIPPLKFSRLDIKQARLRMRKLPDQVFEWLRSNFTSLSEQQAWQLVEDWQVYQYFNQLVKLGMSASEAANLVINKPQLLSQEPRALFEGWRKQQSEVIHLESELRPIIQKVIQQNPTAVADFRSGDEQAINFLIGQVMRQTQGRADAKKSRQLLADLLKE